MNKLTKISIGLIKISAIVFIILYILGVFVALVTGKLQSIPRTFTDVVLYTILLLMAINRYQKILKAGERLNKISKIVIAGFLLPLIGLSSYYVYLSLETLVTHTSADIPSQLFLIVLFSTFIFAGSILLKSVITSPEKTLV